MHDRSFLYASLLVFALAGSASACSIFADSDKCFGAADFCPADPGVLEIAGCDPGWEFSDGQRVSTDEEAIARCLCSPFACNDGRDVDLCTPSPGIFLPAHDGSATFSDGDTRSFKEGAAICFGHAACSYEYISCSDGRWYLECVDGSGDTAEYLAWDGIAFDNPDSVRRYCDGEPYDSAQFSCKPVLICEELSAADCEASGCYLNLSDECTNTASCNYDTQTQCNADAECNWQ